MSTRNDRISATATAVLAASIQHSEGGALGIDDALIDACANWAVDLESRLTRERVFEALEWFQSKDAERELLLDLANQICGVWGVNDMQRLEREGLVWWAGMGREPWALTELGNDVVKELRSLKALEDARRKHPGDAPDVEGRD